MPPSASFPARLQDALAHPNVQAFLRVIRAGESAQTADAYQWLFGSTRSAPKLFDSFDDHPRVRTYERYDGQFIANGRIDYTTAAGAYQITETTWNGLVRQYGFENFSPANQDRAAVALIAGRRALDEVIAGRFDAAVFKLRHEWASLPGASHGDQPTLATQYARQVYLDNGGSFEQAFAVNDGAATDQAALAPALDNGENTTATMPLDSPSAPPQPAPTTSQGTPMAPWLAMLLPQLIDIVPKLGTLFSSGSQNAQRNVRAVEIVADVAKQAVGARNEQDLADILRRDPAAATAVRQAVEANWFKIDEAAEKSINAARAFNAERERGPGAQDVRLVLWGLTFIELLSLVLILLSSAGAFMVLFVGNFSAELRGAIVTLMLIGGYTGVREYWFGSSRGSQLKTELMAGQAGGTGTKQ